MNPESLNETTTEKTKRLKGIPMAHLKSVLEDTLRKVRCRERSLPIEFKLHTIPLSANKMSGRSKTFETKEYQEYRDLVAREAGGHYGITGKEKFGLVVQVAYSTKAADIDNCLKPLLDSITACVDDTFDDRQVYHIKVDKIIVKKRHEYIKVRLYKLEDD